MCCTYVICVCVYVCVHDIFFIHSSIDEYFNWFHILNNVNNIVLNMGDMKYHFDLMISFPKGP